jgi:alpha-mannosidase
MQVQPANVVVTAIHRRTDKEAASVRMFNPTGASVNATVALPSATGPARLTNLEGKPLDPIQRKGEEAPVNVPPKRIITVQFGA